MAARAIWKGVIRFGEVSVPVKLYSAVEDRSIHFRLLHESDQTPLEQRMVDPDSNEPVEYREAKRGFAVQANELVVLGDKELASIAPKESRDIEVVHFVELHRIGLEWYDRPYYLGPDGDTQAYFALAEALKHAEREGIVRWVMRKKEYTGSLRVYGDHLALMTLRRADEVIAASELPKPASVTLNPKELKMAEQLVAMFEDTFDASAYRDEYRDRVLALVEAKAKGKPVKVRKFVRPKAEGNLAAALAESLKQARQRKVA
jgi:DNA end-binding protein Ku